ncbi:hypothetical protein QIH77_07680 [Bradyrhizobium diazoefficiens]|uniref:hypothetical protein n=1 Tax=Bradyrhizobium diazoefficiens TaxID=1355477 RepID=UPI00272DB914|nr:hypothetical protein [Bradyrhizobium diazoefficiens]WLA75069.1 hypothetical protein QIH77_07680 [Bradyrhizobium diazoefficiens]
MAKPAKKPSRSNSKEHLERGIADAFVLVCGPLARSPQAVRRGCQSDAFLFVVINLTSRFSARFDRAVNIDARKKRVRINWRMWAISLPPTSVCPRLFAFVRAQQVGTARRKQMTFMQISDY